MRHAIAIAATASLLPLAACSTGQMSTGTVSGKLAISGGIHGPGQPALRGVPGVITVSGMGNHRTVDARSDGSFSLTLSPGSYVLSGRTPNFILNGHQGLCEAAAAVTISAGRTTTASVVCHGV